MKNTLIHVCCAPCSIMCIETLRSKGIEPTAFWYNNNIHPFTEYRARRDAMKAYAQSIDLPLIVEDEYGLRAFVQAVADNIAARCVFCYRSRLERTAQEAAARGFDSFTTSLLVSPYQNREAICKIGAELGAKYGVEFLPEDFRPYFHEGQDRASALDIYMQKYCGCIFSEEERFSNKRKKELKKEAAARRAAEAQKSE
ncbi:MAG: epoxyqueuosine reductase QueH [Clostridia bacterium]|nr:epoxyqueuosine reductase QueH [Clostridia bacterium]